MTNLYNAIALGIYLGATLVLVLDIISKGV